MTSILEMKISTARPPSEKDLDYASFQRPIIMLRILTD